MVYRQLRSDKLKAENQDLKQSGLIKRLNTPLNPALDTLAASSSTFKLKELELYPCVPDGGINSLCWWSMFQQSTTRLSKTQKMFTCHQI